MREYTIYKCFIKTYDFWDKSKVLFKCIKYKIIYTTDKTVMKVEY